MEGISNRERASAADTNLRSLSSRSCPETRRIEVLVQAASTVDQVGSSPLTGRSAARLWGWVD